VKLTLDVTGTELAVLYILCGNEDAGRLLKEAIREQRKLEPPRPPRMGRPVGRKGKRNDG
jgi:hypothetical protein